MMLVMKSFVEVQDNKCRISKRFVNIGKNPELFHVKHSHKIDSCGGVNTMPQGDVLLCGGNGDLLRKG